MRFKHFVASGLLMVLTSTTGWAQNYQLKYSDLLRNCGFIHRDEFSLESFQQLVQSQLEARVEGDNACQASYRALNTNLTNMLAVVNQQVDERDARALYGEVYGDYVVSLQTELALLDPQAAGSAARAAVLQSQIQAMNANLLDNRYSSRLYDRTGQRTRVELGQQQIYNHLSGVVQGLSQLPAGCVEKVGGWQQVLPVILNVASFIGVATGQWYLPAAAAGVQVGVDVATMLSQAGPKNALRSAVSQRNNQILACTYQAMTHHACELRRAATSVQDTPRVEAILANRFAPGLEGEYERFHRMLQSVPRVREIIGKIAAMGSAVTLDVELIARYFRAVKVRPREISVPPVNSPSDVLQRWFNDLGNRGIEIPTNAPMGGPVYSPEQRHAMAVIMIKNYIETIDLVVGIIQETRSFRDLRDELVLTAHQLPAELRAMRAYLTTFPSQRLAGPSLPSEYTDIMVNSIRMLDRIIAFVTVTQTAPETHAEYLARVNLAGQELFTELSDGTVAQITSQTVLLIPDTAFARFERAFRSIELYYLSRDLDERNNPQHPPYITYIVNKAMQMRVRTLYRSLSGSGQAFRLEGFEGTKTAFEDGFKTEIRRMVDNALESRSAILGSTHRGRTAAHLCALFSDHLWRNERSLYRRCQRAHRTLPLYAILRGEHRPSEMRINYSDPCFYNAYKREEYAQGLLFDKLLDRGFGNKRRAPSMPVR
jgi:hypothetical protein